MCVCELARARRDAEGFGKVRTGENRLSDGVEETARAFSFGESLIVRWKDMEVAEHCNLLPAAQGLEMKFPTPRERKFSLARAKKLGGYFGTRKIMEFGEGWTCFLIIAIKLHALLLTDAYIFWAAVV